MNRNLTNVLVALVAMVAPVFAQNAAPSDVVAGLAGGAEERLEASIRELNAVRETIANQKLPLAEQLTAAEQKVTQLRREHERVTRLADTGNLEIPNLKAEIKARQDELSYIANLLDEYARTFETKLHQSELQYCSKEIEAAKQATENTTLTQTEKFARQLGFVTFSVQRIADAIGGMRFKGVGVDPVGNVSEGQYAMLGPVALFRGDGGAAGVVVPQTGSVNPLIRPLEGAMQEGIGALVHTGEGVLPLDPSRGAALKALVQKTNLIHIFKQGGPIMWPLLAASVIALAVVIERIFFLLNVKRTRNPKALERLLGEVERGNADAAVMVSERSNDFVVRALRYALGHKEQSLSNALLYAQAQELKRFRRGVSTLDTVITLAPLLGLLGTVTGMMGSFSLIGGDLGAPGAITGGIAEALIATAFGLGIAITALIPFNILNTKTDDARHELESASAQVELAIRANEKVMVWGQQRPITALVHQPG